MSKRSEKMYKDSPRIEDDESGKKVIKKGPSKKEKESAEVNAGTSGMPEHEKAALELSQKHEKERLELHHKHEKEHHAVSSKHMREKQPEEKTSSGESKIEETVKEKE